ncbi:putative superoxide dismutase [Planoprotostelium fungivorum]|uniref:Putative superoxide dismutase n=1 Tax=Planoprotostelium fungivorum TaxID=1890364 RepID=A0A2P6NPL4_9EUKA|nr:putative superoxide dismutase [Planoprotostelium fungivorum]
MRMIILIALQERIGSRTRTHTRQAEDACQVTPEMHLLSDPGTRTQVGILNRASLQCRTKLSLGKSFAPQQRGLISAMIAPETTNKALLPLYSPRGFQTIYDQTYLHYLKKLNDSLYPSGYHSDNLVQVIRKSVLDKDSVQIYSYVSHISPFTRSPLQAGFVYNLQFFLEGLTPFGATHNGALNRLFEQNFGSQDGLKKKFLTYAHAVFGSSWVWLCLNEKGGFEFVVTYNGGTLLLDESIEPILVMNMWEHAFVYDHQRDLESYVDAWWETINWPYIAKRLSRAKFTLQTVTKIQKESKDKETLKDDEAISKELLAPQ